MRENTMLRFALSANLLAMPYGSSRKIDRDKVLSAWPPTGDHDRSFEGFFHAMALASGGLRPEESYTTEERIERDLDESFAWSRDPISGDYVFHRAVSHCPRCRGAGVYRVFPEPAALAPVGVEPIPDEPVEIRTVECGHKPE